MLRSALGAVELRGGGHRPGYAQLKLRVAGWHAPVYASLDSLVGLVVVVALLCAKPEWTYAAGAMAARLAVKAAAIVRAAVVVLWKAYWQTDEEEVPTIGAGPVATSSSPFARRLLNAEPHVDTHVAPGEADHSQQCHRWAEANE